MWPLIPCLASSCLALVILLCARSSKRRVQPAWRLCTNPFINRKCFGNPRCTVPLEGTVVPDSNLQSPASFFSQIHHHGAQSGATSGQMATLGTMSFQDLRFAFMHQARHYQSSGHLVNLAEIQTHSLDRPILTFVSSYSITQMRYMISERSS